MADTRPIGELTPRQQRIVDFIAETVRERGYPPTVREIGEAVGLTSSSSVHAQLATLERRGLLTKDPTKPRAMALSEPKLDGVVVPVVGRIAAGTPILADEQVEESPHGAVGVRGRCPAFRAPGAGGFDDPRRDPRRGPRRDPRDAHGGGRGHRRRPAPGPRRGRGDREAAQGPTRPDHGSSPRTTPSSRSRWPRTAGSSVSSSRSSASSEP